MALGSLWTSENRFSGFSPDGRIVRIGVFPAICYPNHIRKHQAFVSVHLWQNRLPQNYIASIRH